MKKLRKTITKDNLFVDGIISLDDKEKVKYFDNLSYQIYLRSFKVGDDANGRKRKNYNYLSRDRKNRYFKKNRK